MKELLSRLSQRSIWAGLATVLALLAAALLTSCAVTYPGKHGNVTLEFSPTPEMLEAAGMKLSTRTLRDK
jgi:hypothetical protein